MKKSILIAMVALFTYNAAKAGNVPPVPVLTSTPNQTWFYNLEDVVFSSTSSYDTDGYVNYSRFYINGVLKKSVTNTGSYNTCFALYGSPAGDCYVLANGVTTVSVKLEVRDNSGEWSSTTTVYTIQQHKGRKYFLTDHLGNVRTTVNRDGNVLGYDDYYAFGLSMPGSHSSNTSNPNDNYKFTGHERDDEAGLTVDYMNARTYDPVIGRFMQVDPLSNEYPSTSPYTYVLNNPLKLIDPTGMYDLSAIEDEDLRREVSLAIKNAFDDLYARDEEGNAKIDKVYAHYGANTDFAKKAIDKILGIIFTDGSGPKVMIGDVEGGNAETLNDITAVTDDTGNLTDISGTVMIDPKADPVRVLTGPYIGAGIKTTGRTMLSRTLLHEGFHVTDDVLEIKQGLSGVLDGRDKFDDLGIEMHGYSNSYFGLLKRLRKDEAYYRNKKRGY